MCVCRVRSFSRRRLVWPVDVWCAGLAVRRCHAPFLSGAVLTCIMMLLQEQISQLIKDITADSESTCSPAQSPGGDVPWRRGAPSVSDTASTVTLPSLAPPKPLLMGGGVRSSSASPLDEFASSRSAAGGPSFLVVQHSHSYVACPLALAHSCSSLLVIVCRCDTDQSNPCIASTSEILACKLRPVAITNRKPALHASCCSE